MLESSRSHFSRRGLAMAAICAATFALMMQGHAGHAAIVFG